MIYLDLKGDTFREGSYFRSQNSMRPVLFVVPGINMDSTDYDIENLVTVAHDNNGFDVVVINYRGCSGMDLKTPKTSGFYAYTDVLEAMTYINEEFCKP